MEDVDEDPGRSEQPLDEHSLAVMSVFQVFQQELDTRYDKYERLVKKSRDITIESKRVIFLLHRIMREETAASTLEEANRRLSDLLHSNWKAIAEELNGEDPYLFVRAYSPGLQEYIEAMCFYHFLKEGQLLPLNTLQAEFSFPTNGDESVGRELTVFVPPSEYILGVADLTGELMRKCINGICSGNVGIPFVLRTFMRQVLEGFVLVGNGGPREVKGKLRVMQQSMDKVENACYAVQVRRKEIPEYRLSDIFLISQSIDAGDKDDEYCANY